MSERVDILKGLSPETIQWVAIVARFDVLLGLKGANDADFARDFLETMVVLSQADEPERESWLVKTRDVLLNGTGTQWTNGMKVPTDKMRLELEPVLMGIRLLET